MSAIRIYNKMLLFRQRIQPSIIFYILCVKTVMFVFNIFQKPISHSVLVICHIDIPILPTICNEYVVQYS